jgi:hypothetical protein
MSEFKIYEPQNNGIEGRAATLLKTANQRSCYGYETRYHPAYWVARLVGLRRFKVHGSARRLQDVGKREGDIVYAK